MTTNNNKRWSKEEVQFIKDNYLTLPIATIADVLGRTLTGVKSKAIALDITRKKPPVIDGKKHCPNCNEYKKLNEFYKHRNTKDGVYSWCIHCTSLARRKKYYEKQVEQQEKDKQAFIEENKNILFRCSRCNEMQPLDKYRIDIKKSGKVERRTVCKPCISKNDRERRLERERKNEYAEPNA